MLPSGNGAVHFPIPESWDTAILFDNSPTHTDGEIEAPPPDRARPARLRQNINPPLEVWRFCCTLNNRGDGVAMT